jgi:subtilisin family serine protease
MGVITVGAVGAAAIDKKANYSNTGPAISIFAPGTNIISSFNATGNHVDMPDQLNNSYRNGLLSGTSMASPQVCGVLACVLEAYPNMKQDEAMLYIKNHAKVNQLSESSGGTQDRFDLQGAPNLYLYVYPERPATNSVYPKVNYKLRPTTGKVYPRVKTRVYK